jgi:hypothetical protein
MTGPRPPRIFFLTFHKILIKTEVPRLRSLGFEVFRPPYREKSSQHQSASTEWEPDQPTTLPREVFDKLAAYDFFYNNISPEVASLVNEHFDAVIVTSDPGWLIEVLKVYRKKVIFRTYGQIVILTEHFWGLWGLDAFRMIVERDDFWWVPHSEEVAYPEHQWLKDRMRIVPYVPSADAMAIKDSWRLEDRHDKEIMIACPNLANPFYKEHYDYLKRQFTEPHYRYYGVQMKPVDDSQVVGTMPKDDYFRSFARVSGCLYTYRNPAVCFLPPIEMMIAGGPVIYLEGSLLDASFRGDAPGRAHTEAEAKAKCDRLLAGDKAFAADVIRSQAAVRERFMPEHVWPISDATFRELLAPETRNHGRRVVETSVSGSTVAGDGSTGTVYVLGHLDRNPVVLHGGGYHSNDPVMKAILSAVDGLRRRTRHRILVTCRTAHIPYWYGYLGGDDEGRLRFVPSDAEVAVQPRPETRLPPRTVVQHAVWFARRVVRRLRRTLRADGAAAEMPAIVQRINTDFTCRAVIVPGPELAPAAQQVKRPTILLGSDGAARALAAFE